MLYTQALTMSSENPARNLGEADTTTQPTLAEARAALQHHRNTHSQRYEALLSPARSSEVNRPGFVGGHLV
jgi:hypothetical protein